jgi:transposase
MPYIGIDLHKHYTHFVVLNQNGVVVKQDKIPSEREAVTKFFSELEGPKVAALEATRNWYWFYDLVEGMVESLKLVAPHKMRVIAESTVKTDKVDARVIAELLRINYLPTCYVPPPEVRQLRELLRHRASLVDMRTKVKNRIHSLLDKLGVRYPFDNLFTGRGLKFLQSLQLGGMYQLELEENLGLLEFLNEREKSSSKLINQLAGESEDCRLLMTIPGIGYHNALLIMAEIGDIDRFSSGEKYASYCGLVPTVRISERTVRYGHLTPQGNPWLRWVYVEAAHIARKKSVRLAGLYARVARKKGVQKAIGAVARELAVISFYVLKDRTDFKDRLW